MVASVTTVYLGVYSKELSFFTEHINHSGEIKQFPKSVEITTQLHEEFGVIVGNKFLGRQIIFFWNQDIFQGSKYPYKVVFVFTPETIEPIYYTEGGLSPEKQFFKK